VAHADLSIRTKLLYGAGSVAYGVKDNGFQFFLLLYYNQVLGLPETWVGLGIMVALVIDAITDPLVGHLSDHWRSRWGRRHPFMYAAALPVAVAYWLLWNPPAGLTPPALFAYFVGIAVLVRVCITFYEIPSAALLPELTSEYDERTTTLAFRFFFGWWGGLGIAILAYAVFLQPDAVHATGVLNPEGYRHYGTAAALVMTAAVLVSAIGTHSSIPHLRQPPHDMPGLRDGVRQMIQTLSNRSFLALFAAGLFGAVGAGLSSALTIYVNTYFWELDSSELSILTLPLFLSALFAVGLAPLASRRLGKKWAAVAISTTALVISPAPIALRLLGLFPANDTPLLLPTVLVFNLATVTLLVTSGILTASMVADLAEDSEVATGRRSEGVFVAANMFVQKAVSGVGIFASSLLLGAVGFPRGAKPGEVDADVIWRFGFVYVTLLVTVYAMAIAFLSRYRISRESHEANLRRLAAGAAERDDG